MTQQKLIDSVWEKFSDGDHLRYLAFCDAAKAYADAETKELEEAYAELKSSYEKFYESDAVQHKQILALNAENKRLRDGIQRGFEKLSEIPYCSVLRTIFDNAKMVQNDLESLLSPAPLPLAGLPKLIQFGVLPPNHFMGMGDDGKPFIGEISTGISPKNKDQE